MTGKLQKSVLKYLRLRGILSVFLLFVSINIFGQFYNGYQMEFGRSRVQYKEFFWTYYKFDRFDIYFYLNGKELGIHTAKYVHEELGILEDELGAFLEGKIQFIIFNSLTDLKQSNIGLTSGEDYNIGGITHILDNKVLLYFDGNLVNFEKQIRRGIVHVLLQNAIFGSNIGSQMMNSILQNFPEWYTKGLIAYLADNWNTDIDNRIRNAVLSGKFNKFNRFSIEHATDAGHSFWKFISDKYGKATVPDIINMTNVSRSIETGFQYVLGTSLKTLYIDWLTYYKEIYSFADSSRYLPDKYYQLKGKRVLKNIKSNTTYSRLKISPDNRFTAFVTNETGKYKIWLKNTETGKLKRICTGGYNLDEKIDYSYPLLTWHPSGRILSIIIEKKGYIWLYFYDVDEKDRTSQNIFGFDKILDFSYNSKGNSFVFSAVQKGQSDIYIYHISSGSFEQITNDIWDDLNPRFINNSEKIIFSSNRISDTLKFGDDKLPNLIPETNDVFLYNFTKRSILLRRVTKTPLANEIQPMEYGRNYISYLSDKNGIYNEFVGKLDSAISYIDTTTHYRYFTRSFPITNYSRSITEHSISVKAGKKAWTIVEGLYYHQYTDDLLLPENLDPVKLNNTYYMEQLIAAKGVVTPSIQKMIYEAEIITDTIPLRKNRKSFRNVYKDGKFKKEQEKQSEDLPSKIDLDNYKLNNQAFISINQPDSVKTISTPGKKDKKDELIIPKQRNYRTEFSINEIVTQLDFSYLNQTYQPFSVSLSPTDQSGVPGFEIKPNYNSAGLSPLIKIGITDLMENYRLMGGVRFSLDFINKEYFVNYANLKKRLDKELIYQRRTLEETIYWAYVSRQYTNEIFFVLTWPFNKVFKIRGTFLYRNENYVLAGPDELALKYPNTNYNWGGFKAQFIYDATKDWGLNLLEGTRFIVFGEYNQNMEELKGNLLVFGFDYRNYKRINRQLIWANRLAGSTNIGTEKLLYYMGGTDNWIFRKFEQNTPIDFSQNWIYQTLATNMRGFKQNARNGNNFIVFNSELRMPVFRYLLNRPIKSELVNNFQLVAFGDVGTAWSGFNPWDEDNVLYTKYVTSGPMRIKVQYEKEPIIGGLGFGGRTKLLGYFVKGDLAWGFEDRKFKKTPMFYFSLSLDF